MTFCNFITVPAFLCKQCECATYKLYVDPRYSKEDPTICEDCCYTIEARLDSQKEPIDENQNYDEFTHGK